MTRVLLLAGLLLPSLALADSRTPIAAPPMTARVAHEVVTSEMAVPADRLWEIVAGDYGRIAESHPKIVKSDYRHGSLKGELGAERTCWFDAKGKRTLHEQIVDWNPEKRVFSNRILEASGFPIDPDNTLAVVSVEDLGNGRSRLTYDMRFRAKPAIMTGKMKGAFRGLIQDYFIAVEHHALTGEPVTVDNFKQIAKASRR